MTAGTLSAVLFADPGGECRGEHSVGDEGGRRQPHRQPQITVLVARPPPAPRLFLRMEYE